LWTVGDFFVSFLIARDPELVQASDMTTHPAFVGCIFMHKDKHTKTHDKMLTSLAGDAPKLREVVRIFVISRCRG